MRATLVERDGDRAMVRLTPSWIARLFGARETVAELHVAKATDGYGGSQAREPAPERLHGGALRWRFVATGREVRDGEHGELILRALERVPVAALAPAVVRRRLDTDRRS